MNVFLKRMVFGCVLISVLAGCAQKSGQAAAVATEINLSDVGLVSIENTGKAVAQGPFLRGLAQLHNFEYKTAAELFAKAREIDPNFVLAYWGEAMTHTHPLWHEQDLEKARAVLNVLASTSVERIAKATTPLEQGLMEAVETLYGTGTKKERDFLYRDRMAALYAEFPGHAEVGSLYALSIMGTAHLGRDFEIYAKSLAVSAPLREANPMHPGLAHYVIHATDDPGHARQGLAAARDYSKIAPQAAHAQHMTSHIFLALGLWQETITANINAVKVVDAARAKKGKSPAGCGHYTSWLQYAYQQIDNTPAALDVMTRCGLEAQLNDTENSEGLMRSFIYQKSLYLFDTQDWSGDVAGMTAKIGLSKMAQFQNAYLETYGSIRRGRWDEVSKLMPQVVAGADASNKIADDEGIDPNHPRRLIPKIEVLQLKGLLAIAEGQIDSGLELLKMARDMEENAPHGFGPPFPPKPSHELYAEELLKAGRNAEAAIAFEAALKRMPQKARLLKGLASAQN